jgi:nitroreductase
MSDPVFVPLPQRYDPALDPADAARAFYDRMSSRRSVRMFSGRPVARETIEWLVRAAGSAPSGANKQPWRFVCVQDLGLKQQIRIGAEEEEREFYARRAGERWLEDLAPLGTDAKKDYLEVAPWLIVVFKLAKGDDDSPIYYGNESVGIAVGLLLAAAHSAGLVTLTHTPSPMAFLGKILGRPENERPYVLIPVGYPADDCVVPSAALRKKPLDQIMVVDRG